MTVRLLHELLLTEDGGIKHHSRPQRLRYQRRRSKLNLHSVSHAPDQDTGKRRGEVVTGEDKSLAFHLYQEGIHVGIFEKRVLKGILGATELQASFTVIRSHRRGGPVADNHLRGSTLVSARVHTK